MRGEHLVRYFSEVEADGSSSHARGARKLLGADHHPLGIIPACAGSTGSTRLARWVTRDHPRMRGEHSSQIATLMGSLGSSPHARGALKKSEEGGDSKGIIPACAGST